MIMQMFWT